MHEAHWDLLRMQAQTASATEILRKSVSPLPVKQLAFHSGGVRPVRRPSLLGAHPLHRRQSAQQAHPPPAAFQGFRKRGRFVTGDTGNELKTPDASQGFNKRHRDAEQPELGALPASTPCRKPSLSAPGRSQGSGRHRECQLSGTGSQREHKHMSAGSADQQLPLSAPGGSHGSQCFSKRNRFVRSASGSQSEPGNPPGGVSRRPASAPAQAAQKTSMRQDSSEPLHHSSEALPEGRAADAVVSLMGDQGMPCKAGQTAYAATSATAQHAQQAGLVPTAYPPHYPVMGPVPNELKERHAPDHSLPGHNVRPPHQASMQDAAPGPALQHHSSSTAMMPGQRNDVPQQHAVPTAQAHQQHNCYKKAYREAQQMQAPSLPGPGVPGSRQESVHSEAADIASDVDSDADVPAQDVTLLSKSISPALHASRGESGSR